MLTHVGEFEHGRGQHQHYHWTTHDWGKFPVSVLTQPSVLSKTHSTIYAFCLLSEDIPIWICGGKNSHKGTNLAHTKWNNTERETIQELMKTWFWGVNWLTGKCQQYFIYCKSSLCHWIAALPLHFVIKRHNSCCHEH